MSFIGERIKFERKAAGMTSGQLAQAVRLTPQYIRLIECGGATPSVDAVLRICSQFPNADSGWWLWLLLRDTWGNEIAEQMRRHAVAMYLDEDI